MMQAPKNLNTVTEILRLLQQLAPDDDSVAPGGWPSSPCCAANLSPPPLCNPGTGFHWPFAPTDNKYDDSGLYHSGFSCEASGYYAPADVLGSSYGRSAAGEAAARIAFPVVGGATYRFDVTILWGDPDLFGPPDIVDRDLTVRWGSPTFISADDWVLEAGHALDTPYHVVVDLVAPPTATIAEWDIVNAGTTFFGPIRVDQLSSDPFCVLTPQGSSPYFAPSDHPALLLAHTHVDNEIPAGSVDGANATFTLVAPPSPAGSLHLHKNGLLQQAGGGNDFTLSGLTITFLAGNLPQVGDVLLASYRT